MTEYLVVSVQCSLYHVKELIGSMNCVKQAKRVPEIVSLISTIT